VLINEGDIPRLMAGGAGAAPAAMPAGGADDDPPWSDDVE
jgi:hypothetical protein